jgi:DNA-binding transcriptional LysR family regulator
VESTDDQRGPAPDRRTGPKSDPDLHWTALRLLEAAVRNETFSRAGAELGFSHSAVSQGIRRLEERIGCELFVRGRRVPAATPLALELAETYREAAKAMRNAMTAAQSGARTAAPQSSI